MIVLDLEVVLELTSPAPAPELLDWVGGTHGVPLHITAPTFADLSVRLDARPKDRRQERAKEAVERALSTFRTVILPFDAVAARQYPSALADATRIKAPLTLPDLQTIAICRAHEAPFATRRTTAFRSTAPRLINPWQAK